MKKNFHLNKSSTLFRSAVYAILILISIVTLFPLLFMLVNSFLGESEILNSYGNAFSAGSSDIYFHLIPYQATLQGYIDVFLLTPSYLIKFWNSIFIVAAIVSGQVFISCISGYGFSKFKYPFKNVFYYLLIILMMIPVQVSLVPQYLVLDKMGLIGSYISVILPGIFSAFGVFLITQVFSSIPNDILWAAKIDGANQARILISIVIPYSKTGIASLVVLSFIDNWNMVEQVLVFLKDFRKYPLSVFLSYINGADLGKAFVCGILAIIPVALLFFFLKEPMIQGIENSNLK